ncbi:MAG: LuxR family transcriptional regulator [Actinophytocola sp.]|nr:LuxR family transcriptional regulator [Actinophytocola sp.]
MDGRATAVKSTSACTKFQTPTYICDLVDRARLIEILRSGRSRRLTLIHAPAGFGKTTLAVQWERVLRHERFPVAWLSLDRDDNDALWFLARLIEAVHRIAPALAPATYDLVEENNTEAQRYVLSELVNRISNSGTDLTVVLDDWHLVDDTEAASVLVYLLDFGPENLHFVVTSRCFTLPIGRLKVANQVTEINADLLRFSQQESDFFLRDINLLPLSQDDVARLWLTTDGWAAALQLATLSLRNAERPDTLVKSFSGGHRSIGDYLAENVFDTLPPDILDFLLTTSISDRLCADLASALSAQPRCQSILEDLERRDLFLRSLDADRKWFRYHHLFADYLRKRLERDHYGRAVILHQVASAWFAANGMTSEAVSHVLAAGDESRAVDLVEHDAMDLVENSRMSTLLKLVGLLPPHLLAERPRLQLALAWANCLLQHEQPAEIALDHVRAATHDPAGDDLALSVEADVIQACIDGYGDRIAGAGPLIEPCLSTPSAYRPWVVAVAANAKAFLHLRFFEFEAARDVLRWARTFQARTGPFAAVYGRCLDGIAAWEQLDIADAERSFQEGRELAQRAIGRRSHAARLADAMLGLLHYERDDLARAEELLEESHELGAESGVADFMIATYVTLARVKALRDDLPGAWAVLDEGALTASHLGLHRLRAAVTDQRVRFHLEHGQQAVAADLLTRRSDLSGLDENIAGVVNQQWRMTRARVMLAAGEIDPALRLLSEVYDEITSAGRPHAAALAGIDLAAGLWAAGRTEEAFRTLIPTLVSGEHAGLMRTFVDAGPTVRRMVGELSEAIRLDRLPAGLPSVSNGYLTRILVASRSATPSMAPSGDNGGRLPEEPLTAREIDIVRLLDHGLSNKEIARRLGVTVNTVKWYLKGVYTKLGVTRRQESVNEARRRNLLG